MDRLKSRKLWMTIGSVLLGMFYPPAIPLLKILTPMYVGAQGIADAAAGLKTAISTQS